MENKKAKIHRRDGPLIKGGLIGSVVLHASWKCVFFHDGR
jgi:hypothetical protein